jgi:hypothetical protein
MHHSGTSTDSLSAAWSDRNDGTRSRLGVTVTNRFGEAWDHARLLFFMVDHDSNYVATGGTVAQTIRQGGMINVYVDCVLPPAGITTVSVAPTTPIVVGVGSTAGPAFHLSPPSPNPFRLVEGRVTVRYGLSSAAFVTALVFDPNGRRVATLRRGPVDAGEHVLVWDGRTDAGRDALPGVYVIRLQTPAGTRTQKLVLVR